MASPTRLIALEVSYAPRYLGAIPVKVVQTLAAAVECLTKRNNDLEEQLQRRNTTFDNQGENQEESSAEERNHGGLEGSNALSRPEGQETNRPSANGNIPSHIAAEMQTMKERMDFMMNALKGR
ncbi:hypothetical protein SO802_021518, partial [Lithocarpus litseifolius]